MIIPETMPFILPFSAIITPKKVSQCQIRKGAEWLWMNGEVSESEVISFGAMVRLFKIGRSKIVLFTEAWTS